MTASPAPQHWRVRPWRPTAVLAIVLALAVILGAWAFQLIGGLAPCPLCLTQRIPFYTGIPVALIALVVAGMGMPAARTIARLGIVAFALAMLISAGIGGYHAGVEWGFWTGPGTCSTPAGEGIGSVGDLLNQLDNASVVRCDEAPIVILGLSLAGWNVIASLIIAGLAARAYTRMP